MSVELAKTLQSAIADKSGCLSKKSLSGLLQKCNSKWSAEEVESLLQPWGEGPIQVDSFTEWLLSESDALPKAGRSTKVSVFSAAGYDKQWFDRMKKELGSAVHITYHSETLSVETAELAAGSDVVCVFVNDLCPEEVVKKLGSIGIKMIALRCAGFDRVDLHASAAAGITVARVPAYSPFAVAEHAVTLLLSVLRHIPQAYNKTRAGEFALRFPMGSEIAGRRVGVIGTGLIGSIAARILKRGFGADVVAYDVFPNGKVRDPEPEGMGIPYVCLDELFSTCDFISLHAPLLPSTNHIINAEAIRKMKKGVIVVNTSRGGLVDTVALIDGLKSGVIGGAGLDVVENEGPYFFKDCSDQCLKDDSIVRLLSMPKVIMTAHQAFFTRDAMRTISDTTLKNIEGVMKGDGAPKQNGKLETECRPAPTTAAANSPPKLGASMQLLHIVSAPEVDLKDDALCPIQNSAGGSYKVTVFSAAPHDQEWFEKINEEFGAGLDFVFKTTRLDIHTASLAAGSDAVCIFVNDSGSDEVLRALHASGVKMIALRCKGYSNVNIRTANELGMVVANVPACSPNAVAEYAVAIMTAVNRRIPLAWNNTRKGNFSLNGLLGMDMNGKRVGLIGTGLTGSIVAKILKRGFECDVVAYDIRPNPSVMEMGVPYVELPDLLSSCDVISLHCPLTPSTKHVINLESIRNMKKGVIIVNTSLGGLIDTRALVWGLREGIIGAAGLDVLEGEEDYFFKDCTADVIQNDDLATLMQFNNVTITSHQAFWTAEALRGITHAVISNINGVRNGMGPPMQNGTLETVVR